MHAPIITDISNNIVSQAYNELNNDLKWCSCFMMFSGSGNTVCRVAMWMGGLQHQQLQK